MKPDTALFELGPNQRGLVSDLRSGRFKQAEGFLCTGEGYCCLGVGAERVNRLVVSDDDHGDHVRKVTVEHAFDDQLDRVTVEIYGLRGNFGEVDQDVLTDAQIDEINDRLGDYGACVDQLAGMNDAGVPFTILADLLEAYPQAWFKEPR